MQDRLAMLWRQGHGMAVEDLGDKLYLFCFHHHHDLRWVIDNRPWAFDNALLVLDELKNGETPTSVLLISSPFWVQVHDLPSRFCNEQVGTILGSFVGKYLDFDSKLKFSRETPYMRIHVLLDVTVPLPIDKKVRQPGGNWLRGKYMYEKLPTFCFLCGRIGHIERHCAIYYRAVNPDLLERKWDASLRAEYRKPVVSGGAQWLVQADKTGNAVDGSSNRTVLTELSQNTLARGRVISRSVVALRKNLGVSLWRPMGEEDLNEEEKSGDEMDGIEVQDDSKRRKVGSNGRLVIRECATDTESRRE
ncbi:hypothetical protein LINGRAHAP2_LOCUS24506 [Linum grandiflorum]